MAEFLPFSLQHNVRSALEAPQDALLRGGEDTDGGCAALITSISQHLHCQTFPTQEQRTGKHLRSTANQSSSRNGAHNPDQNTGRP